MSLETGDRDAMFEKRTAGTPTPATTTFAASNLLIKFALELAALALLAYWGATTDVGASAVALTLAAPALMIGVWGRWAAARSRHRLPTSARIPLELGAFATAAAAGYAAGAIAEATAFVIVALFNAIALTMLGQWEQ